MVTKQGIYKSFHGERDAPKRVYIYGFRTKGYTSWFWDRKGYIVVNVRCVVCEINRSSFFVQDSWGYSLVLLFVLRMYLFLYFCTLFWSEYKSLLWVTPLLFSYNLFYHGPSAQPSWGPPRRLAHLIYMQRPVEMTSRNEPPMPKFEFGLECVDWLTLWLCSGRKGASATSTDTQIRVWALVNLWIISEAVGSKQGAMITAPHTQIWFSTWVSLCTIGGSPPSVCWSGKPLQPPFWLWSWIYDSSWRYDHHEFELRLAPEHYIYDCALNMRRYDQRSDWTKSL